MVVVEYFEDGCWHPWTKHLSMVNAHDDVDRLEDEFPDGKFRVRVLNEDQGV